MRLVRRACEVAIASRVKHRMPASAIAAVPGEIFVPRQVVPAGGERCPIVELAECRAHGRGGYELETVATQCCVPMFVHASRGFAHALTVADCCAAQSTTSRVHRHTTHVVA